MSDTSFDKVKNFLETTTDSEWIENLKIAKPNLSIDRSEFITTFCVQTLKFFGKDEYIDYESNVFFINGY